MSNKDIKQYVYQNVMNIVKTFDYGQKKKNTSEIKTITNDFFDEVHFFITVTELFKLDQKEFEKRWDTISTINELCDNITELMIKKQNAKVR